MAQDQRSIALETQIKALRPRLAAVSPVGKEQTDRLLEVFTSMATRTELATCEPRSLMLAAFNILKLGLSPDPQLGLVWIIARKNGKTGEREATVQIGYQGMLQLARESGEVSDPAVFLVRGGDDFGFKDGPQQHWWYTPAHVLDRPAGELRFPVVAWSNANGVRLCNPVSMQRIDELKRKSDAFRKGYGPWISDYESMVKVAALREAGRLWPRTSERFARAQFVEDRADTCEPQATEAEYREIIGADPDPMTMPQRAEKSAETGE